MKTKTNLLAGTEGFTLIEMMISLTVGLILIIGITFTFQKQNDSQLVQEDVTEMLQSARVARSVISNVLRKAGFYDPDSDGTSNEPFYPLSGDLTDTTSLSTGDLASDSLRILFWEHNRHLADDSDPGDGLVTVGFDLYDSDMDNDTDVDNLSYINSDLAFIDASNPGSPETTAAKRPRIPLLDDVEGIEFIYYLSRSGSSQLKRARTVTAANIDNIQAIQVTMLLRGKYDRSSMGVADLTTYTTDSGTSWGPYNDGFKRRLTSFTVARRN